MNHWYKGYEWRNLIVQAGLSFFFVFVVMPDQCRQLLAILRMKMYESNIYLMKMLDLRRYWVRKNIRCVETFGFFFILTIFSKWGRNLEGLCKSGRDFATKNMGSIWVSIERRNFFQLGSHWRPVGNVSQEAEHPGGVFPGGLRLLANVKEFRDDSVGGE